MQNALQIHGRLFPSTAAAVEYYAALQSRMLEDKTMLTGRAQIPEDAGLTGATFRELATIYRYYMQITDQRMPEPVGFYARWDYPLPPKPGAEATAARFPRMAAYFNDNTEHVFNITKALKALARTQPRGGYRAA